jgi:hypothetical protein
MTGLVLIFLAMVEGKHDLDVLRQGEYFLSYFTVLSNIMSAAAFLVPVLGPNSRMGVILGSPSIRAAVGTYIITTGLVYYLVLSAAWKPSGLMLAGNVLAHYVTPTLYVLDWLVFVPKGMLRPRDIPSWLIFPLVYAAFSLIHGALTGFYPYPFLDVTRLGYLKMLSNCLVLFAWLALLGGILTASDRLLGARADRDSRPRSFRN